MQSADFLTLKPAIEEMLSANRWQELRDLLVWLPEPDIADLVTDVDEEKRIFILRLLPKSLLPTVFTYLDGKLKDDIINSLSDEEVRDILAGMAPDDRADFLVELSGKAIQKLLTLLTPEDRQESLQLLGYPEESVGRLMTTDYVSILPNWTVNEALDHVRLEGVDSETINVIYVVDTDWKLIGVMGLRRLILARPEEQIFNVMEKTIISVSALDDREEAIRKIRRYDVIALPVVDVKGVMLGIVTIDDLFDVAEEEVTEDFQKSAAVNPLHVGYRESSILSLYKKRVLWLLSLLGVSVITTGIISSQNTMLVSSIALASFIPLLTGAGGNTGSQSATLMIRAMATGDIRDRQWIKVLFREILIGCLLGATMGATSLLLGIFRGGWSLALIVSFSMMSIVILSGILGTLLPLILQRLRVDPAAASNPLITSVIDIIGLAIYFSVAALLL